MAEFVLNVKDIGASGKDYAFALRRAWLDSVLKATDARASASGDADRLRLSAERSGQDIVVRGHLHSVLTGTCSRCLEEAAIEIDSDWTTLFTARGPGLRPEPDEAEISPEEMDREFFSGDQIVLDETVREQLLMELPMKPLCDRNCAGIRLPRSVTGPTTDDGTPIDPRLVPLLEAAQSLKDKKE